MNMKKELLIALLAACGTVCAADAPASAKPAKDKPIAEPAQTEAAQAKPTATDEIDLAGGDDSAEAAKKKPSVKVADGPDALVDITCDDATLADILRQFRKTTGANIISADSSNLQQRVSVSLNHVPWFDALQAILNSRKFRLEPRGEIYFVSEDKQLIPTFTRTFALNHASAKELADLFNSTLGGGGPKDPKTGKPMGQIATAFEGANVVVVTAPEKTIADCEQIIKSVDKAIPQIYIEARFIEVSNEAMHKLGMQWNQLESWGATAHGLNAGFEYNNGHMARYYSGKTKVMYTPSGENSDGRSQLDYTQKNYVVPDAINAAPGAGRDAEDMSWLNARGFSGQLSADDFSLALSAFEQMDDVKIFSNPKIIVSNGKEAMVDMTTKFPNVRVQATRNTSNGSDSLDISTQLEVIPGEDKLMFAKEVFFSWGITLSVKPRISPDGLISVDIIPTISQLDTDVSPTGFYQVSGGDSSAYSSYPIIQVKRLTTDFTMKDGATAVIGGLSRTTEEDVDSGIPYLRKIPWIGPKLFGWKSRGKVQKEIVVFVTLGIADPAALPEDVGLPKNAIVGREYVKGHKLEPGAREDGFADVMSLDMRSIDDKRAENKASEEDDSEKTGGVTITPVQENAEAKPEEPKKPEETAPVATPMAASDALDTLMKASEKAKTDSAK